MPTCTGRKTFMQLGRYLHMGNLVLLPVESLHLIFF